MANMKPYASQVTNSLAKPMFYVVGRRSPYMKLRNYLISVQKINSFWFSCKGQAPCKKTSKDLFSAQKWWFYLISCADVNVIFEHARKGLVTKGFILAAWRNQTVVKWTIA